MNDDVTWDILPHTAAKHLILKKYVEAWAPILALGSSHKWLIYIDGFAGPGEYKGGEDGSPVLILKTLRDHQLHDKFNGTEFINIFIEKDVRRAINLKRVVEERIGSPPDWIKYHIKNTDFNEEMQRILGKLDQRGKNLAPCLCFVDPFGWSDINYDVLSDIMKYEKAELFITFMAGYLGRFVWDPLHLNSIRKLYSEEQIQLIKKSNEREKQVTRFFLDNLIDTMKKKGLKNDVFQLAFSAYNSRKRLEYYLVYITKSCKGFEAMKAAMYKTASDGSFSFRDFNFDPSQKTLVDYGVSNDWIHKAADEVYEHYKKSNVHNLTPEVAKILMNYVNLDEPLRIPVISVKAFIICKTVWKYENAILTCLEDDGRITVSIPNRKGKTYPDRGYLTFN